MNTPPCEPQAALPKVVVHQVVAAGDDLQQVADDRQERLRWSEDLLRLPLAWRETKGEGIKVAILDTGIDTGHPDLIGAVLDSVDLTGEGIGDLNGHGTHCAGIVAARANGVGFIGAAPEAQLLICKVLGNNGAGSLQAIAAGVGWAVESGADIISMSLGGTADSPALHEAIHRALALGRMVICAAGNSGALFTNAIGYPGRYGSVITVASHDQNGLPSGFSSRGPEIDLMAPGQEIWSTYKEGGYAKLSGTSMATPFVAGLAALILAKHRQPGEHATPVRNNEELKQHLLAMTAHPGYHDPAGGSGPLLPFASFGR